MMPSVPQLDLEFASPAGRELRPVAEPSRGCWFGLALDHRRLFDALADEWLAPAGGSDRSAPTRAIVFDAA